MAAEVNLTEPSLAPEPSIPNVKHGFWADHERHPYHRLSVEKYVQEFCGWPALKKLMDCIDDDVKKNFFICLFLTGGRVSECLVFRKHNFEIKANEGIILVNDMCLLKRYTHDKNDVYLDAQGKQHSRTARLYETRKAFVIKRTEPFARALERYLEHIDRADALLFPSNYSHSRKFNRTHSSPSAGASADVLDVNGQHPFTRWWAYRTIREVNDNLPQDLKKKLGLNQVWRDRKTGQIIADSIHLWLHYFRSQRASQLHADYKFDEMSLINYFSWKDVKTAIRYAKQGWKEQLEKMNEANAQYT